MSQQGINFKTNLSLHKTIHIQFSTLIYVQLKTDIKIFCLCLPPDNWSLRDLQSTPKNEETSLPTLRVEKYTRFFKSHMKNLGQFEFY